jgi:hypothetical protein
MCRSSSFFFKKMVWCVLTKIKLILIGSLLWSSKVMWKTRHQQIMGQTTVSETWTVMTFTTSLSPFFLRFFSSHEG